VLAAAAAAGDQEAFGVLVEERWAYLVRLARSVVGDLEAEDAVQDALLSAWRALPRLAAPDRFGSWVSRIVFRRCLRRASWWRRRLAAANGILGDRWHSLAGPAPEPEKGLIVWQVLSRLPPRQRAVLHLTVVEGMTDREIATELGIAAGSVRAHRRRARERIEALWSETRQGADRR